MLGKLKFYSVAEAKAELSRVLSSLKENDVVVTKNGVPIAAVVEYEKYVKMVDFLEKIKDLYLLDIGRSEISDPLENILKDND
jgi:prevent-host-death family protein